ncbi:unnamed protein product [Sphagnum balticum]
MADGNAALRDIASSRQRYNSRGYSLRGCKFATLRRRCCSVTMASRADRLLWRAGSTTTLLCSDGIVGSGM